MTQYHILLANCILENSINNSNYLDKEKDILEMEKFDHMITWNDQIHLFKNLAHKIPSGGFNVLQYTDATGKQKISVTLL